MNRKGESMCDESLLSGSEVKLNEELGAMGADW